MRSHLFMLLAATTLSATACSTNVESASQSLAVKCTVVDTLPTVTSTLVSTTTPLPTDPSPTPIPTPDPTPTPMPTTPTDCPVCRDASGNELPADKCVVHDDVCHIPAGNPGADAVHPTQALEVMEAATASPAIAYYGSCDGNGGQCEQREFAYELTGTELAVATFSHGVTKVWAVPPGAHAVKSSEPIFPILPATAYYRNLNVHVVFRNALGQRVEGYGDMQNDCRVVSDDGSQPSSDVPCWCTLC